MFVVEVFERADRVVRVGPNRLVNFDHLDQYRLGIEAVIFAIVGAWDWGFGDVLVFGFDVDGVERAVFVADLEGGDGGHDFLLKNGVLVYRFSFILVKGFSFLNLLPSGIWLWLDMRS